MIKDLGVCKKENCFLVDRTSEKLLPLNNEIILLTTGSLSVNAVNYIVTIKSSINRASLSAATKYRNVFIGTELVVLMATSYTTTVCFTADLVLKLKKCTTIHLFDE